MPMKCSSSSICTFALRHRLALRNGQRHTNPDRTIHLASQRDITEAMREEWKQRKKKDTPGFFNYKCIFPLRPHRAHTGIFARFCCECKTTSPRSHKFARLNFKKARRKEKKYHSHWLRTIWVERRRKKIIFLFKIHNYNLHTHNKIIIA